tara:strand:+ start:5625 stop:6062 length:438 start_codon:yes stop_codon:yes gene_type:complete
MKIICIILMTIGVKAYAEAVTSSNPSEMPALESEFDVEKVYANAKLLTSSANPMVVVLGKSENAFILNVQAKETVVPFELLHPETMEFLDMLYQAEGYADLQMAINYYLDLNDSNIVIRPEERNLMKLFASIVNGELRYHRVYSL